MSKRRPSQQIPDALRAGMLHLTQPDPRLAHDTSVVRRGRSILPAVPRSAAAFIPEDHVIVLFGALGDLARRKLLPGLFHLDQAGLMPTGYKIIGTSRRGGSDDDFRRVARD